MNWQRYVFLCLLSLGVVAFVAFFQDAPGYMDADYYYAGSVRLAQGHGFSELILWNYLDDPNGLPHPSHGYWMPLSSLLAAVTMKLSGVESFVFARMGFIGLAVLVPLLTASLSYSITGKRNAATLAGLLAIFSAFYLPYMPTTDAFGLYMVLGAVFWLLIGDKWQSTRTSSRTSILISLLLGVVAGLLHLARTEGVLWLAAAFSAIVLHPGLGKDKDARLRFYFVNGVMCSLGYLIVMGPWMWRNLSEFGTMLAPGGAQTLWLTNYDELFIFPASLLTPERWINTGLGEILRLRLSALGQNLQTTLAVQGGIFLLPLLLAAFWRLRHRLRIQVASFIWLLTLILMSVIFPFAGARGGFFHSGAGLQPLLWAVVPVGLDVFISWGSRVRGWRVNTARGVFQVGLVIFAMLLSGYIISGRVVGSDLQDPEWGQPNALYSRLEDKLQELGAQPHQVVMVNNSPGYFIASGRKAISIPYGDVRTLLAAAGRYQAEYLLLELNQLQSEDDIFANPGDRPGLQYLATLDGTRIYQFVDP